MQRWSRARRKTERLIDFDGSSAAPRGVHTYSCQPTSCQLPARFYDYSCSSVADETFTRHKRPAPQICPPPVVVSDNSFHSILFVPLYHLPVLIPALAILLRIYIFHSENARRIFKLFETRNKDRGDRFGTLVTSSTVFCIALKQRLLWWLDFRAAWEPSRECNQHIIKRDDENEFFSAPERRKDERRRFSGELCR